MELDSLKLKESIEVDISTELKITFGISYFRFRSFRKILHGLRKTNLNYLVRRQRSVNVIMYCLLRWVPNRSCEVAGFLRFGDGNTVYVEEILNAFREA